MKQGFLLIRSTLYDEAAKGSVESANELKKVFTVFLPISPSLATMMNAPVENIRMFGLSDCFDDTDKLVETYNYEINGDQITIKKVEPPTVES